MGFGVSGPGAVRRVKHWRVTRAPAPRPVAGEQCSVRTEAYLDESVSAEAGPDTALVSTAAVLHSNHGMRLVPGP